jgi:hypothetical protein
MVRRGSTAALGAALTLLTACGAPADPDVDPQQVDAVETPELGSCRVLDPDDVAEPSNATKTVDCSAKHTAQTFAVGELPDGLAEAGYDDAAVSEYAYQTCSTKFQRFLGADESLVMRTVVSWAWFRPSEEAWDKGARWYRCDVVGGGEQTEGYADLPETAEGLLQGRPQDEWMVCVAGDSVAGSARIPCSRKHDWRAVTTIKLGDPEDDYPGDRLAEVTTRDFCSDSVGAWLNYPVDYEFAYTWFHEAEWEAGNRRSVCWAKTVE